MKAVPRLFGHWMALRSLRSQLMTIAIVLCLAAMAVTVPLSLSSSPTTRDIRD